MEYTIINPLHVKVSMHDKIERLGPLKIKERWVPDKSDIKTYYIKSIFKKGYLYFFSLLRHKAHVSRRLKHVLQYLCPQPVISSSPFCMTSRQTGHSTSFFNSPIISSISFVTRSGIDFTGGCSISIGSSLLPLWSNCRMACNMRIWSLWCSSISWKYFDHA